MDFKKNILKSFSVRAGSVRIKYFLLKNYKTIAVGAAIVFVFLTAYLVYVPVSFNDSLKIGVEIEEGDTLKKIARKLKEAGLVRFEWPFIAYIRIGANADELKAGRFILSKSLSVPQLAEYIVSGKSIPRDIEVLIPEGFNVWEIDDRLTRLGLIDEGQFSIQFYDSEGYLFPDSYRLRNREGGASGSYELVEELRNKMSDNFNKKTAEILGGLSLAETREIIVIASILEKEARREADMKLVSSVIRNRLKLGMDLEIDATVTYGACLRNFQSSISISKVKNCDVIFQGPAAEIPKDGPFNTYIRGGLPPAPISNPGLQAIEAALNPTQSSYLYYLSTRDGSQMIFSKTAGEHVANRRKYLGI